MRYFFFFQLICVQAFAQHTVSMLQPDDIPQAVFINFQKQYPGVQAEWQSEFRGRYDQALVYEATFVRDDSKHIAIYGKDGDFRTLVSSISTAELPQKAQDYMKQHYPDDFIRDAIRITKNSGEILYETGIARDGKLYDIQFSRDGTYLQMAEKTN
jgi:hypothetical protein